MTTLAELRASFWSSQEVVGGGKGGLQEKGARAGSAPRQILFDDDSVRPRHRMGYDPDTPRSEVEQPGTPEGCYQDLFAAASWTHELPSIRVVGRGMEERVHGGRAAFAALSLCRELEAAGMVPSSPFQLCTVVVVAGAATAEPAPPLSAPAPPHNSATGAVSHAGAGAPTAALAVAPRSAGKAAGKPRQLAAQDSASSFELCAGRVSIGSLPSPCGPSPLSSAFGLAQLSESLPAQHFCWPCAEEVEEEALGTAEGTPASSPRASCAGGMMMDGSGRVHGSSSFSDLCLVAQMEEEGALRSAAAGAAAAAACRKLGAGAGGQRLARLDSGPPGGLLLMHRP